MKPSIQTLGEIFYSPSQYVVPVFQRTYRWEQPQWTAFWESLLEIQQPDKIGNHFMGFLVFVPGLPQPGRSTRFHLIDGQQRLTTASILLVALRDAAKEAGQDDLAHEIEHYYLIHPMKKGEQRYRLLPKGRDYESYVALVDNKSQATGRMADAVAYFREQLASLDSESPDPLRDIFNTLCQRFEFMCATLEAENAYNIFKSLNSTGVRLGQADLIRNFVFMHVPPDEQDEFDAQLWQPLEQRFAGADGTLDEESFSDFFRDYLMSFGRYVRPRETFVTFEARYEATGFSPYELARSLITTSEQYAVISGQRDDESQEVTTALAALNRLESSTTYPVLLALFRRRAAGDIDAGRLADAINMLSGFIMRRFIVGESSRGYGRIFVRALEMGVDDDDPIEAMETYLTQRGWPDDRQFIAAFVEFPLYVRGYARVVLETLERARAHKEPADLANAQIEHIMPQTLNTDWRAALGPDAERIHTDWLHRPGNLTLSGYNPELLNHAFSVKRRRYAESNIGITRELANYEQWTEAEMRTRGEKLAEAAAKLWTGSTAVISTTRSERHESFYEFWTQFLAYAKAHSQYIERTVPSKRYYMTLGLGRTEFWLVALLHRRNAHISVELRITDTPNKAYIHLLEAEKEQIEQEIGMPLKWRKPPDKKLSAISAYQHHVDPDDRARWAEYQAWLVQMVDKFYACFGPRIETLDAADYRPEVETA